MTVSIIIPNYNGEKILKKNFESITRAAQNYVDKNNTCEIIYVDDGSNDKSLEILEDFKEKKLPQISVLIVKHEQNQGFSSAVNTGVLRAIGEIVVLLNTDVQPKDDFLSPLLVHFTNEKVFAVGCMDESIESGKTIYRGRGVGRWTKGFLLHSAGRLDKSNTLWVSGGSGAYRRKYWVKLGGLSEIYNPYYWEDIDLSYRALKAGYTLIFEKKSIVVHEHEQGSVRSSSSQEKINQIAYRNQFLFVWINITQPFYLLQHILWLPYHIYTAKLRDDKPFLSGFRKAISLLGKSLAMRKSVKKYAIMSDTEIISTYTS